MWINSLFSGKERKHYNSFVLLGKVKKTFGEKNSVFLFTYHMFLIYKKKY